MLANSRRFLRPLKGLAISRMPPATHRRAAVLVMLAGFAAPSFAATYTAGVVGMADGDIVTALDASKVQHRIRLSGIDGKITAVRGADMPQVFT